MIFKESCTGLNHETSRRMTEKPVTISGRSKAEQRQSSRSEKRSFAVCRQLFYCLVEEWKDCEELKPQPKENLISVDMKREETRHRTEWCAEARKYRCMRCGKGSKCKKFKRKMHIPKVPVKNVGEMVKATFGKTLIW